MTQYEKSIYTQRRFSLPGFCFFQLSLTGSNEKMYSETWGNIILELYNRR